MLNEPTPTRSTVRSAGPAIGVGVVLVALFALSATLGRPIAAPSTGAAGWLPSDGYRQRFEGPDATLAAEWAIGKASTLIGAGPETFTTWLSLTELDWRSADLARLTTVVMDAAEHATGRRDDLWSVDPAGVRTEAEASSDGTSRVYVPGRLDLPDQLAAGAAWSSEGAVLQQLPGGEATPLPYRASYTATAPAGQAQFDQGCVTVHREELIGEQQPTSTETTWCPSQGVVGFTTATGSWRAVDGTPVVAPEPDPAFDWSGLDSLVLTPRTVNQVGVGNTFVSPVAPPGVLPDGTVVFANHVVPDVIALRTGSEPPPATWRSRPGRRITTAATFGTTTVVATTDRQAVAYGPAGQWLWYSRLGDLALAEPVRLGDLVVIATLDGAVTAHDLATGAVRWRATLAAEVRVRPVVAGDRLLVVDQAGALTCLDTAGAQLWNADIGPVEHLAVSGGDAPVVVAPRSDGPSVYGYSLADGSELWRTRQDVTAKDALALDHVVVLRDDDEVIGLDPATGARAWSWAERRTFAATGGGDRLLLLAADELLLLDGAGHRRAGWPVAVGDVGSASAYVVAAQGRVLVYGPTGMAIGEPT